MPKDYMIGGIVRPMYTTGDLARSLDRQDQTIRKWERQGIIPKTPFRSKTNRRLYTDEQIQAIVDCVEKHRLQPGVAISPEFIEEVHNNFKEATPKLN
jgi:hypothetical protein